MTPYCVRLLLDCLVQIDHAEVDSVDPELSCLIRICTILCPVSKKNIIVIFV